MLGNDRALKPGPGRFIAPEFVFGKGAIAMVANYARQFGARKPLIVTDYGVTAAGWTDKVIQVLADAGIPCEIFSDVSVNPRDSEVMAGASFYQRNCCDTIIAVGGGSPMDCAKAIGVVARNHVSVSQFEGFEKVEIPGPPLICIPTTAGTSADVSQFAIINDVARRVKFAIISKSMIPDVALITPETTLTMSPYLTACTAMDALVHAIEAVVSIKSSPVTDLHAFTAIRLIRQHLPGLMLDLDNLALREKIMFASLQAGLAFSNAGLGAVHAMAHSLGGLLDLPHGEANALLLNSVIAFNYTEASARYDLVGEALGLQLAGLGSAERLKKITDDINLLKESVGITVTLGERGAQKSDVAKLAEHAIHDPCMSTNPRQASTRDLITIFQAAL